jgi:hypothetical protein
MAYSYIYSLSGDCYDYESLEVEHHFDNPQSLAFSYLVTIGSKALILEELWEKDNNTNDNNNVYIDKKYYLASELLPSVSVTNTTNTMNTTISKSTGLVISTSIDSIASLGSPNNISSIDNKSEYFSSLSSQSTLDNSNIKRFSFGKGLNEESLVKLSMLRDEQYRVFRCRFTSKNGINVYKRSRNGINNIY